MLADGRAAGSVEIVTDSAFLLKRRSAGGDGRSLASAGDAR
jgi:hypothetical protein